MASNVKNYTEQGGDVTHFGGKVVFEEGSHVEGLPSGNIEPATDTRLGGVKIGSGIHVKSDGTISAEGYEKPQTGIPKNDLSEDVKHSLEKADTALQEHQSLTAYALKSEIGYRLNLEIDSTSYVITPKMYDKDGVLISTGDCVDLPLESVVVSGSYNKTTKKVVLVLKDGSQIEFSVADLIEGLVSQTDFDAHSSDTEKHITSSERAFWNEKYTKPQTGIPDSDLAQQHYTKTEADSVFVAKQTGKGLSENDYSNEEKQKVSDLYAQTHSHSNIDELNLIQSGDKAKWDAKAERKARVESSDSVFSIRANTCHVVTQMTDSLNVTLENPVYGIENEYRLIFEFGNGCALQVYAPAGFTILGLDNLEFRTGCLYEVSFAVLDTSRIGCICKEWEIS